MIVCGAFGSMLTGAAISECLPVAAPSLGWRL
jgi:hypothetical protein